MRPVRNGIAMKKIMTEPWVLNSWAKCSGSTTPGASIAVACWTRISTASISARLSITKASTMYMMPMRLWSRLVSQSDHKGRHQRFQVRRATTASAPSTTIAAAPAPISSFNDGSRQVRTKAKESQPIRPIGGDASPAVTASLPGRTAACAPARQCRNARGRGGRCRAAPTRRRAASSPRSA